MNTDLNSALNNILEKRACLFHHFLCFIDQAKMDGQADQLVECHGCSIFYQ